VITVAHHRSSLPKPVARIVSGFDAPVWFLAASLTFGGVLVFLTPPFQVPDEPGHFFRAYALTEGVVFAENRVAPEREREREPARACPLRSTG
jgi:hypothetical protein